MTIEKQKIIIGIDYSLNSTGLCIWNKTLATFKFCNITSNKKSVIHKKLDKEVSFSFYDIPLVKDDFSQMWRLNQICYLIFEYLDEYLMNKLYDVEVRIEGFSYNSKGSSFIDLISGQSFVRKELIDSKVYPYIISPKTLKKKFSGSGNADKCGMLDRFMETRLSLRTELDRINSTEKALVNKSGKISSPISDLIDAYALTQIELD